MTSPSYLLDTDTISYRLRGESESLAQRLRFIAAEQLLVSSITVGELLYGIKPFPLDDPRRLDVSLFLAQANVLCWDERAASAYADIRHSLTRSGQLIGELDMMIAAHAVSAGLILVTNNTAHFNRLIPPLQMQNWVR